MSRGASPLKVRLRRLLVILPWLAERGSASLAEMSERFQISEKELVADLEQAAMCGLPPFLDELVDLYIDDDGVAFNPTTAHGPRITSLVETATVGGMGLQLVRSAVRAFRYRREASRNVVEAEIALLEPLGKGG